MHKIFFFILFILLNCINLQKSFAAQSPDNVGDFFRSIEQGDTANTTPDAGGSIQSLPGVEIKQEQMQQAFPTPLKQNAPTIDFIPDAAPLFPALPLQNSGSNSGASSTHNQGQNNLVLTPSVPSPQPVPNVPLSQPNQDTSKQADSQSKEHPFAKILQQAVETATKPQSSTSNTEQAKQYSLDNPSLEIMVGQMIMAGFNGGELEKEASILSLIREGKVGGVFLIPTAQKDMEHNTGTVSAMQENIFSPSQVRVLTATLQGAVAKGALPLFIATEQEGGLVQSLRPDLGFSGLDAAAHLGQGTLEATEIAARSAGLEMAGLGINFALGPAGDVNINPLSEEIGKRFRSFGPNPQQVAAHVLAFGKGLEAAKIIPCLRNFPGMGSRMGGFASIASTTNLQNILHDIPDIGASWQSKELIPYSKAVDDGWHGAIQPALVYHRVLDALHPAPLSRTLLHGILRSRIGFDGIILSQDISLLQPRYNLENAVVQAVLAGVDIILIGEPAHLRAASPATNNLPIESLLGGTNSITKELLKQGLGKAMPGMGFGATLEQNIQTGYADQASKVYDILLAAVRNGQIPIENVRASWKRILKTKSKFLQVPSK